MKALADLLSKYKQLKPTDSLKKEALIEVIKNKFKFSLDKKNISINNNIYFLKITPVLRTEINLNKFKILIELRKILGSETPNDIK